MSDSLRFTGTVSVVAKDTQPGSPLTVGVVGAGQLARMMAESASALGINLVVLASDPSDSATSSATRTILGVPSDLEAVSLLAACCDVLTLDHELVDLELLDAVIARGTPVYPAPFAVAYAARKDLQRRAMAEAGIPVPAHLVLDSWDELAFDQFTRTLSAPPVLKMARGGYDGRGVALTNSLDEARQLAREWLVDSPVIIEERLELLSEVAALLVTGIDGERARWPIVRTVQQGAMCVEVNYPSGLDDHTLTEAARVVELVANVVGAVGVLAVELFVTSGGVLLNEVATRPHNCGHWTIEGTVTSQFENHLRAVLGLPLGVTDPLFPAATMVNVVGSQSPGSLAEALAVPGLHVHDYGKSWRPGRKVGHVTALGVDATSTRVRAWRGAELLGTAAQRETP